MSFKVVKYSLESKKCSNGPVSLVFLSDLHLIEHGKQSQKLIGEIEKLEPDAILIGGDMIVGQEGYDVGVAEQLITMLAKEFKVYYALGNHEQRLKLKIERFGDVYEQYRQRLQDAGVIFLDNESCDIVLHDMRISLYGLNLPLCYYKRFVRHELPLNEMYQCIGGIRDKKQFNILLGHHPRYADTYFSWGADLILSGHIHGGMMRLGKKAVISPDIQLFPKYGYGKIKRGNQTMIVSGGIGEHTIPIRLFNPRELVYIEIK